MKLSKKIIKWTAISLLWLLIWQLAALKAGQEILIPTPKSTFISLFEMLKTGEFWISVNMSMLRIIVGYLLGVFVGVAGAVISARFALFKAIVSPVLHLVRAVPVASFIILALVWFKSGTLPIFISFLMVLPMIWGSVETAITGIDVKYLELAKVYRITPIKTLFQIKIPLILPSFISAAMTALGFAWKSGIAAEVICKPKGSLGGMLQDAKLYIETPEIFALTAVVAILSLLLEIVVRASVRRFTNDKY